MHVSLLGLDPGAYASHELHSTERSFPETNCYTDVWIELLHALGHEPLAALAYCVGVDFEGDQWTFFKPPPADLELLYGAEVLELQIYRPLPGHLAEQLRLGRPVIIEVDAFYLPDTAGRSYREQHEKTGIAVETIDEEAALLRYFHNTGYYELTGDDYRNALRIGREFSADVLPPYVEFVRLDRLQAVAANELHDAAHSLLRTHLARLPETNPVLRFGERLEADIVALEGDPEGYHRYAFATLRQCGAAWEVAASFLAWLGSESPELAAGAAGFAALTDQTKLLLFKLARATATGRPFDSQPAIENMSRAWDETIGSLTALGV